MDVGSEDEGNSQGTPAKRRKTNKENPDERRRKNRERKRATRAKAAARRPEPRTSSSDEEQPREIGGIPQVSTVFPVNYAARRALAHRIAEGGEGRIREAQTSINGQSQGNTGGTRGNNPHENTARGMEDCVVSVGTFDTAGCDSSCGSGVGTVTAGNEDNPWSNTRESPTREDVPGGGSTGTEDGEGGDRGNDQGSTNVPPAALSGTQGETRREAELDQDNIAGNSQGGPGETPELCQPLIENPNTTEKFALLIAKIKGASHVSDAAVDKILQAAAENQEVMRDFWQNRGGTRIYTGCLRPTLEPFLPKVYSGVLLEEKHPTGLEYRHELGLTSIPKEYQKKKGNVRVIREESYVTLADIKRHYMGVNAESGMTKETAREHFRNAALSVDGVQESHKGKKKFHVVTIRFGQSIFLYKIFNPLVGHPAAQPSLGELLG